MHKFYELSWTITTKKKQQHGFPWTLMSQMRWYIWYVFSTLEPIYRFRSYQCYSNSFDNFISQWKCRIIWFVQKNHDNNFFFLSKNNFFLCNRYVICSRYSRHGLVWFYANGQWKLFFEFVLIWVNNKNNI